jgi:hypothetical protein
VELEELHVFERHTPAGKNYGAIAGIREGIGRGAEHSSETSCCYQNCLGAEYVQRTCGQFQRNKPNALSPVNQHIDQLKLVKERDVVLNALLVQRLEDHVPGAVGGVTCPPHGSLAEILGVTAEPALVYFPLRRPAEWQPAFLKIIYGSNRIVG